jgi:hypothetical protein
MCKYVNKVVLYKSIQNDVDAQTGQSYRTKQFFLYYNKIVIKKKDFMYIVQYS